MTRILVLYCSEREKEHSHYLASRLVEECPNFKVDIMKITMIDKISLKDFDHVIAIMPLPILIRKIGSRLVDKLQDPSVTLISPNLKYVIPICGEHSRLGIDIANMVSNILKSEVVSTCASPYYSCVEYVISKLKLVIKSEHLDMFKRMFLKDKCYKIYVDDCFKVCKILTKFFNCFSISSSPKCSDIVISLYRDSRYDVPTLYYPVLELSIPLYRDLSYILSRASLCFFTVPDRFDVIYFSGSNSMFSLKQYFIS